MNRFRKSIPIVLFSFLSLIGVRAFCAFVTPDFPKGYVNDYAGILTESARQQLEQSLKSFEAESSNQVFVATFPSLEGENLEDVSMRLAEKWKAGQKDKDNGVILLVFKNDRKLRIEVGYGLEGVLTDALSKSIIQNEIVPYFKQGDYSAGILAGVAAIQKATQGEYRAKKKENELLWNDPDLWVLLGVIFVFFLLPILRGKRGRNGITFGSGGWGGSSSWGGGGGFSGGGGGGFGGGGSSGSW